MLLDQTQRFGAIASFGNNLKSWKSFELGANSTSYQSAIICY
jgi:hypothetical protein